MSQTSNPFALAMAEAESRPLKAKRRMPVAPPHAILAADILQCGHCHAHLPGIYDWSAFSLAYDADGVPDPAIRLWHAERQEWEQVVWCMAASVRRHGQRTGRVQPRRGWDAPRERGPVSPQRSFRDARWPTKGRPEPPCWAQCWRCEYVNRIEVAPVY